MLDGLIACWNAMYHSLASARLLSRPLRRQLGHHGAIFGHKGEAYSNARTGRTVVIASTMSPGPAAAESPLATATDLALCGEATAS